MLMIMGTPVTLMKITSLITAAVEVRKIRKIMTIAPVITVATTMMKTAAMGDRNTDNYADDSVLRDGN